jgi:hypothetical protein
MLFIHYSRWCWHIGDLLTLSTSNYPIKAQQDTRRKPTTTVKNRKLLHRNVMRRRYLRDKI